MKATVKVVITETTVGESKEKRTPFISITGSVKEVWVTDKWVKEHPLAGKIFSHDLWLTTSTIKSGKNEGLTGLQVAKKNLEDVFDFRGTLVDLSEIIFKECIFVLDEEEYKGKMYTKVKFMNKEGASQGRQLSQVSPERLAALNNLFAPGKDANPTNLWNSIKEDN